MTTRAMLGSLARHRESGRWAKVCTDPSRSPDMLVLYVGRPAGNLTRHRVDAFEFFEQPEVNYVILGTTRRIQLRALWALIEVLEVEQFYSPAFKRHCLRT